VSASEPLAIDIEDDIAVVFDGPVVEIFRSVE
jgi:hypothetical protein